MAQTFTQIFLYVLVITYSIRMWLGMRHIRHIQSNRTQVPAAFSETISLEAHQRAADYTSAKVKLRLLSTTFETLLLLAFTLGGGLQWLVEAWQTLLPNYNLIMGALLIASTFFISSLVELPFDYCQTFKVDEQYGFNKMSPAMFFSDLAKHSLVGLLLGAPLLLVALWLMQSAGEYWWFYLWVVWSAFNLFMLAIYPTWIAPLFNKFNPLEDVLLKDRIEQLMQKCGFASQGLVRDGWLHALWSWQRLLYRLWQKQTRGVF